MTVDASDVAHHVWWLAGSASVITMRVTLLLPLSNLLIEWSTCTWWLPTEPFADSKLGHGSVCNISQVLIKERHRPWQQRRICAGPAVDIH